MSDRNSADVAKLLSLAALLERSPRVRRMASAVQISPANLASEAADSLIDIRRSAELLSSELLPRLLTQQPESGEFDDILDDIAEELRHIHYHIANTKLFDYVVPKG
jgi:hypothetical protein